MGSVSSLACQVQPVLSANNFNVADQVDRAFWDLQVSNTSDQDGFESIVANNTIDTGTVPLVLDRRCEAYWVRVWVGGRYANGTQGPYCIAPSAATEVFVRSQPTPVQAVKPDTTPVFNSC